MLTLEQEKWIESLSDRIISIVPYDSKTEQLFERVKRKIQNILGPEAIIEHTGASSLGISGQDEIDVSVVANKDEFLDYIQKLETEFGPVRSQYPDRARFEAKEEDKKIDLKIVDANHPNYLMGKVFEEYLRNHTDDLKRYELLKEKCNGMTAKEYNRNKTEFVNEILAKA
ncbi:MAG TPA: GrpB family protein [Candidatus Paceibacterota bacterium]